MVYKKGFVLIADHSFEWKAGVGFVLTAVGVPAHNRNNPFYLKGWFIHLSRPFLLWKEKQNAKRTNQNL